MAAKVVKLVAVPAALGLASIRVYAIKEEKTEELPSPRELSIYAPPEQQLRYVQEQPGLLQRGFGVVRVGLQPYVRAVKGACTAIKVGVVSVYRAGEDTYNFLRDPPPGFLPRVGVISVSGLAGLILARKGSRLKRLGVPLGLATVGTAVCYPSQTVGLLKVTGKKTYAVVQWTGSSVASLLRSSSTKDTIAPSGAPEAVSLSGPESEVEKARPALPPLDEEATLAPTLPGPEDVIPYVPPVLAPAEDVPTEEELFIPPALKPDLAPVIVSAPASSPESVSTEESVLPSTAEPLSLPLSLPLNLSSPLKWGPLENQNLRPVYEAASPEPQPDDGNPLTVVADALLHTAGEASPPPSAPAALEEMGPPAVGEAAPLEAPAPAEDLSQLTTDPDSQESLPSISKKLGFTPDPKLMDHGQSSPEDADLYSTRG
ncbi:hypothetical protein GJAV_G00130610 [Gymnothorax javanicus]|nr:hypothetical protein GJAV_G00130610 [Gymnothorax javanicus]